MSVPAAWKAEVLRELESAIQALPTNTGDAWNLVWAIGYARELARVAPGLVAPLRAAEAHLAQHRPRVEQLLSGNLRDEPLLAELGAALQARQPEEAQDRLLALEEVLVVAQVLGFEPVIQRILAEAARQLLQGTATLAGFEELARRRLGLVGPAASALWSNVHSAAPSSAGPLMPGALRHWLVLLDEARALLAQGSRAWLERFDVSSVALHPVPVLGRAPTEYRVHVEGHCPPGWQLRLFLVDGAYPDGELLREGEDYRRQVDRWTFDSLRLEGRDDVALLIALAAPRLPNVASLAQAIKLAASMPEARLTEVFLSPPSGQKP